MSGVAKVECFVMDFTSKTLIFNHQKQFFGQVKN